MAAAEFAGAWAGDDVGAIAAVLADDVVYVGSETLQGRDAVISQLALHMAESSAMSFVLPPSDNSDPPEGSATPEVVTQFIPTQEDGTALRALSVVFRAGPEGAWRIASIAVPTDGL